MARFEARSLTSPFLSNNYRSFIGTITQLLANRQLDSYVSSTIRRKDIAWGIVLGFCNGWLYYMPTFC
jgi:hypothetical protein